MPLPPRPKAGWNGSRSSLALTLVLGGSIATGVRAEEPKPPPSAPSPTGDSPTPDSSSDPAPTEDSPRVVVLIFPGSGGDRAREVVVGALKKEFTVVGPQEWEKTAGRLGEVPGASRAEVARIAPELRAQAVFTGNVAPLGPAMSFRLVVRDGRTGDILSSGRFRMRDYDFNRPITAKLERFALTVAKKGKAGEPTLPPLPPPPPPEPVVEVTAPPPPPPAPPPRPSQPSWKSLVDASLAVGMIGRWFDQDRRGQDFGAFPVGAFQLRVAAWPLAHRGGIASRLGLGFGYGQVFSMTSRVDNDNLSSCQSIPSMIRTVDVGLRGRWNPYDSEKEVTLRGQIGWGRMSFSMDTLACETQVPSLGDFVPDATHQLLRMGLGARVPIAGGRVGLQGDLVYLRALGDSGDIGGDGGNGVEMLTGADLRVRTVDVGARIGYTRIGIDAPADNLVGSATDQYLSILLRVGYSF